MVALGEGGSVLKLECHCKGELAMAHRDCALKWFGIKGNNNCDVCGHDVLNLPVTLRRVCDDAPPPLVLPSLAAAATPGNDNGGCSGFRRHGTAILVVVSMLAYFCFLEQLLVDDHGTTALTSSLPFAGVLGLFSSLIITKMVSRRYVWIYSAIQFLFIVLFTHLFYRYVQLQAVIAIILSTFLGSSVAICANTVLQIIRWRSRRLPLTQIHTSRLLSHSNRFCCILHSSSLLSFLLPLVLSDFVYIASCGLPLFSQILCMKTKFEIRKKKDVSKVFLAFIHSILMFVFSTYTSNCPKLTPTLSGPMM
ncbi:uncharacterized protein [Lolium perenne]|uniref:uncharacterized protein n=1 Tax=Lolium perenne TaxID=4522 RepID=UPI0021F5EA57|nr:uncharacterized protein LOC127347460 [Lolium perenne]